jgi:heme-degrading monooxygenase HmoA
MSAEARIVFLVRVAEDRWAEFREAYEEVRLLVADTPGHLRDQVCQSTNDPEQWLITSEWETLEQFVAWERTDEHRETVKPMRACMTDPQSMRFVIRAETPMPSEMSA